MLSCAVNNPRWEPDALIGHVRICAGGAQQWASLPRYAGERAWLQHLKRVQDCGNGE
jgi:hypothetical protein